MAISWDGFTGGQWTYTVEASLDADENGVPDEYSTVAVTSFKFLYQLL